MNANRTLVTAYATALFEAARDQDRLEQTAPQAVELRQALMGDEQLRVFLDSPSVAREDKEQLFAKALGGKFEKVLVNFVRLVVRRGRHELLVPALQQFHQMFLDHKGFAPGHVISAVELADDQKKKLEKALNKFTGKTLQMEYEVDPRLLGGIEFRSGDLLVTNALADQLARLKHNLAAAKVY